jgi:agmatine deiminase
MTIASTPTSIGWQSPKRSELDEENPMSKLDSTRPAALGYRWPAEWESHEATWLAWPLKNQSWPGNLSAAQSEFVQLVCVLAPSEPVRILVSGSSAMDEAARLLGSKENIELYGVPTNKAWLRDNGPIFLQSTNHADAALMDWLFNSCGGKEPPFDLDNAVPRELADLLAMRRFNPGFVLEGGGIDGNGRGTILTTKSCLLDRQRNPTMDEPIVLRYLSNYLGMKQLIWLPGTELVGDDTDGHVDQLARFVNSNTILYASCNDTDDENYISLAANEKMLSESADSNGRQWKIIPLPIPAPVYHDGARLPASYCEFYIANSVVVVPAFDDPHDQLAREKIKQCFPDRDVVSLPATEILRGRGGFHRLTLQQCLSQAK